MEVKADGRRGDNIAAVALAAKHARIIWTLVTRGEAYQVVKKQSLANSIKAMFQFQGGIADSDIDKIISELQKRKYIKIEQNKVIYL